MDIPKGLQFLFELEKAADEILVDKTEILSLSKRQNQNREAMRAVQKCNEKKVWINVGPLLIKMPKDKCTELLKKDDAAVTTEMNKLKSELKVKVNCLQDLEHKQTIETSNLVPLSRTEMSGIQQIWGKHA